MPLAAYLYLCLMLGFDQESHLINGWKQGIFISLVVQDDELQPRSLCSIDERLPHMHFRAGQMVSTKGQRRNGLRHKVYQKCKHQHQHFHWTMFRTGNGQLNGNKEMEQQVRPTLIIWPESDHCLPLSLTDWLTHSLPDSLTHWLLFSKLYWCDPGVWRWKLKTCWGCCYC